MDNIKDKASRWLSAVWQPVKSNLTFFIFTYLLGFSSIMIINGYGKHIAVFELFTDLYIVCLLLYLLPVKARKWARRIFYVAAYTLTAIDIFCYCKFGSPISSSLLQVCTQTNPREAAEALQAYVTTDILASPFAIVPLILLLHIVYVKRHMQIPIVGRVSESYPGLACLLIIAYSAKAEITDKLYYYHNMIAANDSLTLQYNVDKPHCAGFYIAAYRLPYAAKCLYVAGREVRDMEKRAGKTKVDSCTFRSPDIVLIIGEATTRHHLQLYGYPKPTTPRQAAIAASGLLVPFTDVISPHNQTSEVFKTALSTYAYGKKGSWNEYPLFTELMKKAGYNVTFITNQFVKSPTADIFDFCGSIFLNNDALSEAQFSHRNTRTHQYDEGLLADYDSLKAYRKEHNLTIFHLLGCHTAYRERYTKAFNKFKPSDYRRDDLNATDQQSLADYDNAVLYNDYIVTEIIKRFEDKDAIIIYMPDHGEMAFIGSTTCGRTLAVNTQNEVYQQFDIPFWIYVTPRYRESHKDIYAQITAAKGKPFMTDCIDQLILYLAGLSTPYYDDADNVLSPRFDTSRRRMIMGTIDYDSFMKGYEP